MAAGLAAMRYRRRRAFGPHRRRNAPGSAASTGCRIVTAAGRSVLRELP